ncbi:sensor histidine kinase [Streptomyces sp. NPDC001922]|uniref:sensor histidine kinase n=1 Tax=Streptomyces sp. NPDC001922 TaxID=3364624 RepID=UPI0036AF8C23
MSDSGSDSGGSVGSDSGSVGSSTTAHRGPRRRRAARLLTAPFVSGNSAAALYGVVALPVALAGAVLAVAGLLVGGVLSVTPLGPWLIAGTVRACLGAAGAHRALARTLLGERVDAPERRTASGLFNRRRAMLRDPAGWRAVGWLLAAPVTAVLPFVTVLVAYVYGLVFLTMPVLQRWNHTTVREPDGTTRRVAVSFAGLEVDSWPLLVVLSVAGLALLLCGPPVLRAALAPHRLLLRVLLGPSPAQSRIRDLEETRAHAVDDAAATLRRIERDLHDGTQARLVGLGMHLTMIRELVDAGAERQQLLSVVDTARDHAKRAVADLRDLVRGIHPPVLDQGLGPALATLAADCALPVEVAADGVERPPPAIESIAYFCAAELLANVVKHSGASAVSVAVRREGELLRLTVSDDGGGGARIGGGSGLTGLLARVRTVDGTLAVDSPTGGPTVVTVVLPCPAPPC